MAQHITMSITPAARDALRTATLDLTTPAGRRLTMSEVLLAALAVAGRHREEVLAVLGEGAG